MSEKAFNYAVLLLKYRDRSTSELRERILKKGYEEPEIAESLARLLRSNLVNNARFVDGYFRVQLAKGKSIRLISFELKRKFGIDTKDYPEAVSKAAEAKHKFIRAVVSKKFGKVMGTEKGLRRAFGFLQRKGFGYPEIKQILGKKLEDE